MTILRSMTITFTICMLFPIRLGLRGHYESSQVVGRLVHKCMKISIQISILHALIDGQNLVYLNNKRFG